MQNIVSKFYEKKEEKQQQQKEKTDENAFEVKLAQVGNTTLHV